jgi:hypothetical protein
MRMRYGLPFLPALSVDLHLSNEYHPIVQVQYGGPFEKVGLGLYHECVKGLAKPAQTWTCGHVQ